MSDVFQSFGGNPPTYAAPSRDARFRGISEQQVYQEQGLRSIPEYVAILRAIGHGRTEQNQIAQAAGLELDYIMREKLDRLIQLD